jgi:membrane-associated phospholipid phosphatase
LISKQIGPSLKHLSFALLVPIFHIFYLIQNGFRNNRLILSTKIDNFFPFNSLFIIPYELWFLFVAAGLILFAIVDRKYYYQLLSSLLAGAAISYLLFYFYPTEIIRPLIHGNTLFDSMVKGYYNYDRPYNCFPSIHVLYTVIITLFVCKFFKNYYLRVTMIISCMVISVSTLYVKQHYFIDVIAGALIAIILYLFFSNTYVWAKLRALKDISQLLQKHKKSWVGYFLNRLP